VQGLQGKHYCSVPAWRRRWRRSNRWWDPITAVAALLLLFAQLHWARHAAGGAAVGSQGIGTLRKERRRGQRLRGRGAGQLRRRPGGNGIFKEAESACGARSPLRQILRTRIAVARRALNGLSQVLTTPALWGSRGCTEGGARPQQDLARPRQCDVGVSLNIMECCTSSPASTRNRDRCVRLWHGRKSAGRRQRPDSYQ